MVQDSHSVLNINGQKIAYICDLLENVNEIGTCKLFGLKSTTYMAQLANNDRSERYAYIKSPVHVFKEIKKLNGVELL